MTYIVTVTYNDVENLRFTFDSVRKNKNASQKYIVIDGGSKDGSLTAIKENEDIIDMYMSEPDKGLYDAMNKILRYDVNDDDYIIWINAGDELTDWGDFEPSKLGCDAVFAPVVKKSERNTNQKGIVIQPVIHLPYNERNFYPKTLYQHQGFLVRAKLFRNLQYDITIGLQAENLLMSLAILNGTSCTYDKPVSVYYTDGMSNNKTIQVMKSYFKVAKQLGFSSFKVAFYHLPFLLKALVYEAMPKSFVEKYKKAKYK